VRVLIVDDDPDSVLPLEQELDTHNHVHRTVDFGDMPAQLSDFAPDLVVLDLHKGALGAADDQAGNNAYENAIWDEHFCPVVIYSAFAEQFVLDGKTLVLPVIKGAGSEANVLEAMAKLEPYSSSISTLRNNIDGEARRTLRELTLTIAADNKLSDQDRQTMVVAMGRRRAAAYLDDQQQDVSHLPESQYVYPTSGRAYRCADILQVSGSQAADPAAFRLVLSPSCDLQPQGTKKPRLDRILVAECVTLPKSALQLTEGANPSASSRGKLERWLSEGYAAQEGVLFLPGFLSIVPPMCADFRKLNVHDYVEDADGNYGVPGFDRVVSVDSPFRERVAWAFMNTNCRPGIPGVDLSRWIDMFYPAV